MAGIESGIGGVMGSPVGVRLRLAGCALGNRAATPPIETIAQRRPPT